MSRMVLVTGGAGFVGRHAVETLARVGWRVRSLDRLLPPELAKSIGGAPAGPPAPQANAGPAAVEHIQGDILDEAVLERAVRGVDAVVHSAALVPVSRAGAGFRRVNEEGTRKVLEAAVRQGVRKVVHLSSSAVYGVRPPATIDEATPLDPHGDYGRSKAAAEGVCKEFRARGLDVTILRPRTVVGPGRLGILQILFERVRRGRPFYVLGGGRNRFQLVSVQDLVEAIRLSLERPCRNEDFNVGAQEFGTLREDLEALVRHAGTATRIRSLPATPVRWGLALLGALRLSPFVSYHYEIVGRSFAYDTAKAQRVLGWKARYSNAAMLAQAYDWYLTHGAAADGSAHSRGVRTLLGRILKR